MIKRSILSSGLVVASVAAALVGAAGSGSATAKGSSLDERVCGALARSVYDQTLRERGDVLGIIPAVAARRSVYSDCLRW